MISFLLIVFFLLCILTPSLVVSGMTNGLLIWYHHVLPVVLPVILCNQYLLETGLLSFENCSPDAYCLFSGLISGYPNGAVNIVAFYRKQLLSRKRSEILLAAANNISPAFFLSFVRNTIFQSLIPLPVLSFCIYGAPLLYACCVKDYSYSTQKTEKKASKVCNQLKLLDACITNSIQIILKIGCYLMLFSTAIEVCKQTISNRYLAAAIASLLEITSGLDLLRKTFPVHSSAPCLAIFCITFGGICANCQVCGLLNDTDLSVLSYLKHKLRIALLSVILFESYCLFVILW